MDLPPDVLYHVFEHVQDKATIDTALDVVPDIVHTVVRRIHSPRVVQVSIDYLVAFKRLERTTNVLVCVSQEDLDTLRPLSHLRGLCVQVFGSPTPKQLEDIFRVQDKRDDQYFVFKLSSCTSRDIIYRNSHCITDYCPSGYTRDDIGSLRPRPYFDLLQSVRLSSTTSLGASWTLC